MINFPIKPTEKPEWKSETPDSIKVPDIPKKLAGFTIEKPPYEFFNWFWTLISTWIDFISDYVTYINVTSNVTLTVTNEEEFDKAVEFLSKVKSNTADISVYNSYPGIYEGGKELIIKNIAGEGTILWQNSVDITVDRLKLINVENKVTIRTVGGVSDDISITVPNTPYDDGVVIENCREVYIPDLKIFLRRNSTQSRSILYTSKSNVQLTDCVINCVPTDPSDDTLLFPIYNEDSNLIFNGIVVGSTLGSFDYGKALAYTSKNGSTVFNSPTWDMDPDTSIYFIPNWSPVINYTHTILDYSSSAVSLYVKWFLESIEELNGIINVQNTSLALTDFTFKNVKGIGRLSINLVNSTSAQPITIENFKPDINISNLNINATTYGTQDYVYIKNSSHVILGVVEVYKLAAAAFAALKISRSKCTISIYRLLNGSDNPDSYNSIKIEDKSDVSIFLADCDNHAMGASNYVDLILLSSSSKLALISAVAPSTKNVRIDVNDMSMLIYKNISTSNPESVFYGNVAVYNG